MKLFFSILLACVPFFAATSQVVISKKTAEYFLEMDDKYKIMLVRDSLQNKIILTLRSTVVEKDSLIMICHGDRQTYDSLVTTLQQKNSLKDKQNHNLRKQVRSQKRQKIIVAILAVASWLFLASK